MDPNSKHRIRVKLGINEFEAEGERETVQTQYADFLAATKAQPSPPAESKTPTPAAQPPSVDPAARAENGAEPQVSQEILSRVFQVRGAMVSLLALPRGDTSVADACLMLLYGFRALVNTPAVTGVSLMEACRQSGVQVDRLDRVMRDQTEYVNAGGARRGRRYSLNNPGMRRAAALVVGLV